MGVITFGRSVKLWGVLSMNGVFCFFFVPNNINMFDAGQFRYIVVAITSVAVRLF